MVTYGYVRACDGELVPTVLFVSALVLASLEAGRGSTICGGRDKQMPNPSRLFAKRAINNLISSVLPPNTYSL